MGHRVVLSTGRSRVQVPDKVLSVGFDAITSGSGWRTELPSGLTISDGCFDAALVDEVVAALSRAGVLHYFEAHEELAGTARARSRVLELIVPNLREPLRTEAAALLSTMRVLTSGSDRPKGVTKIVFLDAAIDVAPLLPAGVRTMPLSIGGFSGDCGEILPTDVDKAVAMEDVLKHFGLPNEASVAIGDGHNDVGMLRLAAVGIAMGNASAGVRQAADLVTDVVEQDGLAHAFATLGLYSLL